MIFPLFPRFLDFWEIGFFAFVVDLWRFSWIFVNFAQIPQWYMRRVFRIIQHFEIVLHQEFVQRLGRVSLDDSEDMDATCIWKSISFKGLLKGDSGLDVMGVNNRLRFIMLFLEIWYISFKFRNGICTEFWEYAVRRETARKGQSGCDLGGSARIW